jgi:hypothetical protein
VSGIRDKRDFQRDVFVKKERSPATRSPALPADVKLRAGRKPGRRPEGPPHDETVGGSDGFSVARGPQVHLDRAEALAPHRF